MVLCLRRLGDLAYYCWFGSDVGQRAALQRSLWNEPLCAACLLSARICVHKYTSKAGGGILQGHLPKIENVNKAARRGDFEFEI